MTDLTPDPGDPYWNVLRNVVIPDAKKQPDRSAAIVLGSVVDEELRTILMHVLVHHTKVQKEMFHGVGPLATFSSRIKLGYLLGLYPLEFHDLLHGVREVRNAFAHEMSPLEFTSAQIVKKMKPLADYRTAKGWKTLEGRDLFIGTFEFLMGGLHAIKETPRLAFTRKAKV